MWRDDINIPKAKVKMFQEPKMEMEPCRRVLRETGGGGGCRSCLRQEPKQEEGLERYMPTSLSLHISVYCHCILLVKSNN